MGHLAERPESDIPEYAVEFVRSLRAKTADADVARPPQPAQGAAER